MSTHIPDGDDGAAVAVVRALLGLELRVSDGRFSSTHYLVHRMARA